MKRQILFSMLLSAIVVFAGCENGTEKEPSKTDKESAAHAGHSHGPDELHWPKKDIEHEGFSISLGHHGNHWHGGEQIEPAVAIVKDGQDIGDAKVKCQLMDGQTAIDDPVEMIFEPKTDAEPAHFAGAKLTFPEEEKKYTVNFEFTLPGVEETFSDSIEVTCGH